MFKFKVQQKVLDVAGIKVGGSRDENPPVLIGSIFYHKHKIVKDENKGEFDKEEAERLIKSQEEVSDKTKIPCMVDVVAQSPEAMVKYIDFVSKVSNKPLLIDTSIAQVMRTAFSYAKEVGLLDRVIFNSLTYRSKDEELNILKEYEVKSAILLLYTSRVMDVNARLEALKELLIKSEKVGIRSPLIDTFVIDIPSLSAALRTIIHIKSTLGLPCGCGAHNAISVMRRKFKEAYGEEGLISAETASNIAPIVLSADFVLYGPIEACKIAFPAAYVITTSYRYLAKKKELMIEL
ncbi:MAG: tetrahydromethanopterin S-methyltransferase subunit H [Candidatus Nezhaarchaeota archaeon]|nr:tetrahydromethanopterin S-methyltransferase subunit H [Candidatus Nezhaarchaeota archaeon]MCX8141538.1 tetrahydromethanopterin S-methyltransferase subunit H [Candidatus Nezhaarchaeota archaeon]MDW8049805.1 tetrahydromethanopterin S-methyltransferase subunit H [Nitrososphaerota archaeon]